jgi:hypothetical protein
MRNAGDIQGNAEVFNGYKSGGKNPAAYLLLGKFILSLSIISFTGYQITNGNELL